MNCPYDPRHGYDPWAGYNPSPGSGGVNPGFGEPPGSGNTINNSWSQGMNSANNWGAGMMHQSQLASQARGGDMGAVREYAARYGGGLTPVEVWHSTAQAGGETYYHYEIVVGEGNAQNGGSLSAGIGDWLLPTEKHYNGSLGLVGAAVGGYNKIPNDVKRKYAYKLSKTTGIKSGQIFQKAKVFVNGTGKLATKLGPLGNALTIGVITYEVRTDTWDAHTIVNGTLLVGAGVATFFAAPVVLTGIAAYGIGDYFFDFSGSIDATVGRESGLWTP